MKKLLLTVVLLTTIIALTSCSGERKAGAGQPNLPEKAGVAPYDLSESDIELLQALGIHNKSQIVSFNAPEETKLVEVRVYILKEDGRWEHIGGTGMSSGEDSFTGTFSGTFTMLLRDNYAIDYFLKIGGGGVSFKTEEIDTDSKHMASLKGFLTEFKEIEFDKEIPVAVMVYDSGTTMRSHEPEHYFTPSVFEGMDLVQAVTLTFSDKANPPAPGQ